ncbi:Rni-like protein, partial [Globisporangium splendens]
MHHSHSNSLPNSPLQTPNQKLILDRLVYTPPFTALTIFSLGLMRGSSVEASKENLRRVYLGALLMNWRVWTVTQWLSFHYVPPQLRVLWAPKRKKEQVHTPIRSLPDLTSALHAPPLVDEAADQMQTAAPQEVPSLTALCVAKLARDAPPRALMRVLRRLPEELVMSVLAGMIASNTLTDDRLATFFMAARRVLQLQGCSMIRNSILRQIPYRCPHLVTSTVVRAVLQGCSNLQILRLDGCRHITDAAFQHEHSPFHTLRACSSLQVVSFARCSQLSEDLLYFLVKTCRSLVDINFSKCKKIQSNAIHLLLRSATNLQRLNLSFMDATDEAFTVDPQADHVNGFYAMGKELRVLDLTHCKITDAALLSMARYCRQLEEMKLSSCDKVTDIGVEALVSSCANLRELDLNNCGFVTDRGISAVGLHGKRLERLNLSWCMNITDKCIVDLARGCSHLKEILLVWCTQLTDASLDALMTLDNKADLKIHLSGCKGVSKSKIAEARRVGLQIVAAV